MKKLIVLFIFLISNIYCQEPLVIDKNQIGKTINYIAITGTTKGSMGTASNPLIVSGTVSFSTSSVNNINISKINGYNVENYAGKGILPNMLYLPSGNVQNVWKNYGWGNGAYGFYLMNPSLENPYTVLGGWESDSVPLKISGAVKIIDDSGNEINITSNSINSWLKGSDIVLPTYIMDNTGTYPLYIYPDGSIKIKTIDSLGNTNGGIYNPYYMAIVGYPSSADRFFENSTLKPIFVNINEEYTTAGFEITTNGSGYYSQNLITPTAGTKFHIKGYELSTHTYTNTNGYIKLSFNTSGKIITKRFLSTITNINNSDIHITGNNNEGLTCFIYNGGANQDYYISITYREE